MINDSLLLKHFPFLYSNILHLIYLPNLLSFKLSFLSLSRPFWLKQHTGQMGGRPGKELNLHLSLRYHLYNQPSLLIISQQTRKNSHSRPLLSWKKRSGYLLPSHKEYLTFHSTLICPEIHPGYWAQLSLLIPVHLDLCSLNDDRTKLPWFISFTGTSSLPWKVTQLYQLILIYQNRLKTPG